MGLANDKLRERLGIAIRTPLESIVYFHELNQQGYQEKLNKFGGLKS
jgi:hypothetical protein